MADEIRDLPGAQAIPVEDLVYEDEAEEAFQLTPMMEIEEVMPLVDDLALGVQRLRILQAKAYILRCKAARARRREEEQRRLEEEERAARKQRRWWTRPWLLTRTAVGHYHELLRQLEREDVGAFKNFVRINPQLFTAVLERIEADITKQDTHYRKALEPGLKLAITLRFLATGDSYKTLMYGFRVASNTISKFIPDVCEAIVNAFGDEFMATPDTEEEWREIEAVFRKKWNLPHCLGAIDGKHVALWCPPKSGSEYFNYKSFFSIVLMAVVDGNYRFLNINVGAKGAGSDGGVFAEIDFKKNMDSGLLNIPPAEPLPGGDPTQSVPYFFVGDEAFPLKTWLMKPLPRRNLSHREAIYNYRISRARRVVENAFGILAARFRCLLRSMQLRPRRAIKVVIACCCLHNILRTQGYGGPDQGVLMDREDPVTHDVTPGLWRLDTNMLPLRDRRGPYGEPRAKEVRDILIKYVNEAGAVPWQDDKV